MSLALYLSRVRSNDLLDDIRGYPCVVRACVFELSLRDGALKRFMPCISHYRPGVVAAEQVEASLARIVRNRKARGGLDAFTRNLMPRVASVRGWKYPRRPKDHSPIKHCWHVGTSDWNHVQMPSNG